MFPIFLEIDYRYCLPLLQYVFFSCHIFLAKHSTTIFGVFLFAMANWLFIIFSDLVTSKIHRKWTYVLHYVVSGYVGIGVEWIFLQSAPWQSNSQFVPFLWMYWTMRMLMLSIHCTSFVYTENNYCDKA